MAHYAIICPEEAGHLLSMGELGKELVRRGHRVTIVGTERSAVLAGQLGFPHHELGTDDIPECGSYPLWLAFRLAGAEAVISMRIWFCQQSDGILRHAPQALKELDVDGVLVDHIAPAGGTAAERRPAICHRLYRAAVERGCLGAAGLHRMAQFGWRLVQAA